ncbi:MAG: hypothetical protein MMC33_008010 [Icmadophila ericetorum]|nr:hypothetical protein [Icmadophila ericetorum]
MAIRSQASQLTPLLTSAFRQPRNQGCVDTSTQRTAPVQIATCAQVAPRSGLEVFGYTNYTQLGPNSLRTIASVNNGGSVVNGIISNGLLSPYGLSGKVPSAIEEVWCVNRPGYA